MPTSSRREHELIDLFLSAYEDNLWEDCEKEYPEKKKDSAVEIVATRKSDRRTLAIEHTLIEPFPGEKRDFFQFRSLLRIEQDKSLAIPGHAVHIDVPVGTLQRQARQKRFDPDMIVDHVHDWLRRNTPLLPIGRSEHACQVGVASGSTPRTITLKARVVPIRHSGGKILIRRWVDDWNYGNCVEKALKNKLTKLRNADIGGRVVDKRILLLERDNMRLSEEMILDEIKKRAAMFPNLASVDEVWFAETISYDNERIVYFWLYDANQEMVSSLGFHEGRLIERTLNGMSTLSSFSEQTAQ